MTFLAVDRILARMGRLHWPQPGLSINAIGNLAIAPTIVTGAGNVTLTAGTEVNILATAAALVGVPGMNYVPLILASIDLQPGNPIFTALTLAARYNGGSDFDTHAFDVRMFSVTTWVHLFVILVGANVRAAANGQIGSGAIQLTGLAATTAGTASPGSSKMVVCLLPGPDA